MEQKSIQIIEKSIKLFAKKGFSSTSVQEIANECGISKGAFYLHFKSKDALLFEIFNYYFERVHRKIDEIQSLDLDPRTKFTRQLNVTFEEVADHREFIIMQIREQTIPFNENIDDFLKKTRFNSYMFYKRHLQSIYGKKVESIIWEVSLLLQGIFKGYMDLIIIENVKLDFEALSHAILRRTDFIVEGFLNSGDQPVIDESFMNQVIPKDYYQHELDEIIKLMNDSIHTASGDTKVTLGVLLDEVQKNDPRTAIIKGMVSNLEETGEFQEMTNQIKTYFQI